MSISIILFIVFSSFVTFTFKAAATTFRDKADFQLYQKGRPTQSFPLSERHYRDLKAFDEVDRVYTTGEAAIGVIIPKDKIHPKFDEITHAWVESYEADNTKRVMHNCSLINLGDENLEILEPFLLDGDIDSDILNEKKGVIFVRDSNVYNSNTYRYMLMQIADLKVGDIINIDVDYHQNPEKSSVESFEIVGIVEKGILDFEYNLNYGMTFITSDELFDKHSTYPQLIWEVVLKDGADKGRVLQYIRQLTEDYPELGFWDWAAEAQESRKGIIIISIFLYGFVSIITLISSLNIINTISTNLLLRTRELAMFKAIGMTQRDVKQVIALEGLFYGLTAAIYGGSTGAGLSYILYRFVINIQEFSWQFPWLYTLIASLGATLVALLSGYIPLKKMDQHIVVEDIRAVD